MMVICNKSVIALVLLVTLAGSSALKAEWIKDGVSIYDLPNTPYDEGIVSDGAGGCIIVWKDYRLGTDIYAQRVDKYGTPLWTANGVAVCSQINSQSDPRIIPDGVGGAFITWEDGRNGSTDIYAQRIDKDGNSLWTTDGVAVCTAAGDQASAHIATDALGGVLIVWCDFRAGNQDIYMQRLDGNGTPYWTTDGVAACSYPGDQIAPQVIDDCWGGGIVVWYDRRVGSGNEDIYAQRINSAGTVYWAVDGNLICSAINRQKVPRIVSDCACGAIIAWQDERTVTTDVYAQRVSANGWVYWTADGVPVCAASGYQESMEMVSDDDFGAILTWADARDGTSNYDIFAQRLDEDGNSLWTLDGTEICTAGENQLYPAIVSDGSSGAMITWRDQRSTVMDIYAQGIDAAGTVRWTPDGAPLCRAFGHQWEPFITTDGAGGAIAFWKDSRIITSMQIVVQRIERNGFWGYPSPQITAARDVPGDQGGYVNLSFDGSRLDPWPDELIAEYSVWRAINPADAALLVSAGRCILTSTAGASLDISKDVIRMERLGGATYYWKQVSTLEAHHLESYSEVVPTLFDSTAVSTEQHYFQVIAHGNDPSLYWISQTDSSYSVDNLSPDAPLGLAGEQSYTPDGLMLSWDHNAEPDLGYYAVYRGTSEDFVPAPGNLIASPADTFLFDGDWRWDDGYYYKVSAIDINGNESVFALFSPNAVTGDEPPGTPPAYFLEQNYPNPFNPITTIVFGIKEQGYVSLRIYDAAGRIVAMLVDETRSAGQYTSEWNGRSVDGRAVSSGVYFYRLITKEFKETRKMILLR